MGVSSGEWLGHVSEGIEHGPNLYAYVKQNPWTAFDPDGLKAVVYYKNKEDYDHATKVQKNSKDGGFYKDARLILLKEKDPRNAIFDKSTPTRINGVVEGGVRYDKGSFIGTDAAWFFDNTTHAKSITDWFNLGGSLADVSKGVLANIGNGTALTASAQVASKTSTETIKQVEKAAAAKAEQTAADLIEKGSTAVVKGTHYEVNGFKFTKGYYEKLWNTGRGAPSIMAKEVLEAAPKALPDAKPGFFRYEAHGWEMIFNPTTKEVWHLQPMR